LDKILEKILGGLSDRNIDFDELVKLMVRFGFIERVKGDHHVMAKTGILEIINIQPLKDGKSKAYQVKQIRNIILKYKLHREVKDV
jgi:hypothetical protein